VAPEAVRRVVTAEPPRFEPPFDPPPPRAREELINEKWLGQRGLLAVGVVLVLLAVGYLLKLAFDRGWISPALRCAGGVVAGLATAAIGARLLQRGVRTYGAAVIGLGFGMIYLSLWAASSLYALVPPGLDIAGLTFVSLALAAVAYVLDIEALCVAAAAGAFIAPVVISNQRNPDGFILYLAVIGATLGGAAASKRWRYATFVVALSVLGLGVAVAAMGAAPLRALLLGVLAGTAGLYVGLRYGWPETRFLAFGGGWGLLASATQVAPLFLVGVGGMVLAAPAWSRALRSPTIWPDSAGERGGRGGWSLGEAFYFYLTPLLLAWAVGHFAPVWFRTHPGGACLFVGIAYAIPGFSSEKAPYTLVAAGFLAAAALTRWPGVEAVWALLAMSLVWAGLDRVLDRTDGRWYALGLGTLALGHLLLVDLVRRDFDTPAFSDAWAVSLWLSTILAVVLAAGLWRTEPSYSSPVASGATPAGKVRESFRSSWISAGRTWPPLVPAHLWTVAGLLLLFGVTGELIRLFRQSSLPRATAHLASGLSVSAWWAAFAGGLVVLGFARGHKQVRLAGLAVAGLAVGKVLLLDLATLDALYRVASVFILGFVSLVLAYLYHRHEKLKA
jgi:uncharacterized membrane protein